MKRVFLFVISIAVIACVMYLLKTGSPAAGFAGVAYPTDNTHITFLTASDTANFLLSDADTYSFNLSPLDLHARHAASYQEYQEASARSARSFTSPEVFLLTKAAKRADKIIQDIRLDGCPSFANNLKKIPWVFASTEGSTYEDGLPHTRLNIIFLSSVTLSRLAADEKELVRTLIHEKIHIQQRLHPIETLALLKERGYIQWKERKGIPRIRANPDLDQWVYTDPNTKKEMAAYYTSDTPSSISDITLTSVNYEHPYEAIAYEVTSKVL
ncbi:hypothetical protein [Dishui Lake large algae virus 1]|nr:hypothetical protein [Dishui Lake large algae virus 1]